MLANGRLCSRWLPADRQRATRSDSDRDACHAELLGERAGAVAGEGSGQEIPHLGGLGVEQHDQRGRVVAISGHASGTRADRAGLRAALDHVRAGDVLVTWKPDRLGRSLPHLIETVASLEKREVGSTWSRA